jgi:hypothetical protein
MTTYEGGDVWGHVRLMKLKEQEERERGGKCCCVCCFLFIFSPFSFFIVFSTWLKIAAVADP